MMSTRSEQSYGWNQVHGNVWSHERFGAFWDFLGAVRVHDPCTMDMVSDDIEVDTFEQATSRALVVLGRIAAKHLRQLFQCIPSDIWAMATREFSLASESEAE